MHISQLITSSNQALKGSKLRTGLTMLGMVIGISSVILISSIGQGAVAFITDQLSVFGTNYFEISPGQNTFSSLGSTSDPLTTDDAEAIINAHIPNVESVAPFGFANSTISGNDEKTQALVYGLTADSQAILKPDVIDGQFISDLDNTNHAKVAVLGYDVSKDLFGEDANPVGDFIRIDNQRYRVIGVTKASGALTASFFNNAVNVPLSSMIEGITGVDQLIEIDISVKNEDLLNQTIDDVETVLKNYRDIEPGEDADFHIQSFKDSLATIQTITNLLTLMVTGISGISLLVGGIGIMNIMLVTVTERTKEIGLLKAIGAREQDILIQFLIESVTLSLVGGSIGIILGLLGAFAAASLAHIPFIANPVTIFIAVTVSSLVGILFGLYPARKAANLNPIDALRYE